MLKKRVIRQQSREPRAKSLGWIPRLNAHFRRSTSPLLVMSILTALCTMPSHAAASSDQLTLFGRASVIAGTNFKVIVHLRPGRSGVGVTLLADTESLLHGRTNAHGNATFVFTLRSGAKFRALVTQHPETTSRTLNVAAFHRTGLKVDWPTTAIKCTHATIGAHIWPASTGRKVALQYQSMGSWSTESTGTTDYRGYVQLTLVDNSNGEPVGSTISAPERIFVAGKDRYLSAVKTMQLTYQGCGNSSAAGENLNVYYLGNATVGYQESYSWDLRNTNPLLWMSGIAKVNIDICNADAQMCDYTSMTMSTSHQQVATVHGNDSGTFIWVPTHSGNYVVRVSLWSGGQMLDWMVRSYAISGL